MPQLQTVTIKDRASTPVDHVFTPRDVTNNVGTVVESTGTPIGDRQIRVGLTKTPSRKFKVKLDLALPVVQTQTVNGVSSPTVVRVTYVNVVFTFDETSTEQERKDAVGLLQNSLAPGVTLINDTVIGLQGVY